MNTPAHVLIAFAVAGKPESKARNSGLIAGALFPDVMIFAMVAWERWVNGFSFQKIFDEIYFTSFWQEIFAINNSAPLFAALLLAGVVLRIEWLWAFGLAALLHALCDLPLHNDDGHPHFWPFTDWVYASPVSYWDPDHHGFAAGLAEAGLSVAVSIILLRRFKGPIARIAISVALFAEVLTSVGFGLMFG